MYHTQRPITPITAEDKAVIRWLANHNMMTAALAYQQERAMPSARTDQRECVIPACAELIR